MGRKSEGDGIESFFEDIDLSEFEEKAKAKSVQICFWLPAEYKEKYDLIQQSSGRKFGKLLKKVLMKSIDRVKIEDKAS